MKIEISGRFAEPQATEIEAFTISHLTENKKKKGAVEMADKKAERACAAFGRLLDILAAKGILSAPEIARIVVEEASALPEDYSTANCVFRRKEKMSI